MVEKTRSLVSALENQITESDSGTFEVGEQRERNHRYYSLQPMGNEQRGRSHYVSPDVLDSVESKKAIFKKTFLTGRKIVDFSPVAQNPNENEEKSEYCELVMKRNKRSQLFRDAWHDAFVAKRLVTMTLWREQTRDVRVVVQNATQPQLMQILAQQNAQGTIVSIDPTQLESRGGMASGDLIIEMDDSYPEIVLCMPERYYREPTTYPDDALWNTFEEDVSRGELKDRGYDPDQVDTLSQDYRWRSEEEDSSRKAHDRSWTRRRQHNRLKGQNTISFYRTWTWIDLWENDFDVAEEIGAREGMHLYEIHWAQGEVMRWADGTIAVREVDEQPFDEWTEYKIAHAEHGLADADITSHTQKTQSTLKRLIIDNQQMRNTSRWEVLEGALRNPRDLLDNRIGGMVVSKKPGAINALPTPELSPLTLGVIGLLDQDNDRRSGMSGVARGMNPDVISNQNSEAMIDKITNRGNMRVTSAVRDYAENYLVPLYQRICRLAMQNDKRTYVVESKGQGLQIAPQTWIDTELNTAVAEALTPEENAAMAQQLLMIHQVQTQDPQMGVLYGLPQKRELFERVYDALGIKDTMGLMVSLDSPQFAQAMQQSQMQQQQMQQMQMQQAEFQRQMVMDAARREWEKINIDATDKMQDNMREDDKFNHQVTVDFAELEIEREQKRSASIGG